MRESTEDSTGDGSTQAAARLLAARVEPLEVRDECGAVFVARAESAPERARLLDRHVDAVRVLC